MDNLLRKIKSLPDEGYISGWCNHTTSNTVNSQSVKFEANDLKTLATNYEELVEAAKAVTENAVVAISSRGLVTVERDLIEQLKARIEGEPDDR
jgi:gamma-glutamyl-gamma-aminobutyrate hydrolase PuuD